MTDTDAHLEPDVGLDDEPDLPFWGLSLTWPRIVILLAAFTFLGGAIVYYATTDKAPDPGSVDVGFYKDMTYHHEQAIEMAVMEQANGADPTIRGFAMEIIRLQSREMGIMADTLDRFGYTAAPNDTAMAWMDAPVPLLQMPGLATADQMDQLKQARGAESDRLFLQLMSAHHRGGVHMATYAYRHASDPSIRDRAQRMAWNQAVEINEFRETAQRLGINVQIDPQQTTVPDPNTATADEP